MDDVRLDGLRMLAEWSKWLAAIDTAAIGGLFLFLARTPKPAASQAFPACIAMAFLLLSLWGACQFLFSMPGVVMRWDTLAGEDMHKLRHPSFAFNLGTYHNVQYLSLYPAACALVGLVWTTVGA